MRPLADVVAREEDEVVHSPLERRLHARASRRRKRDRPFPALDDHLADDSPRVRIETAKILDDGRFDLVVTLVELPQRTIGAAVDHQRAAGLARPTGVAQCVRVVEQHVERRVDRENGIDVVPWHRTCLAGQDATDDERSVDDGFERRGRIGREVGHDLTRNRRRRCDDRAAGTHLLLPATAVEAHADPVRLTGHPGDRRARHDTLPEPPRQLLRQRGRPAAEVVAEHDA